MNPFVKVKQQASQTEQHARVEQGVVLSTAETNSKLSPHTVKVYTATQGQFEAEVLLSAGGDFYLPPVDSMVMVQYLVDNTPVVIGSEYIDVSHLSSRPAGGERIIGHPLSDSHIFFDTNGNITISGDDSTNVNIDITGGMSVDIGGGSLSINGGSTPVVTDVTTTKDADGHVTDISLTTNNSILL